MWGLAAVPKAFRSERVNAAIHSGLDFLLLKYSMVEANYPPPEDGKKHEIWNKISFPLFYQSDILHVLRILAELGQLGHPNAQPAIDWLKARQKADRRFKGSSPFKQRVWRGIVEKEDADRWVTLQATGVLMKAGEKN